MRIKLHIFHKLIASALIVAIMQSCFTGIESTKRISEKDVNKNIVHSNSSLDGIFNDDLSYLDKQPIVGRRLIANDDKINLIFEKRESSTVPFLSVGDTLLIVAIDSISNYDGREMSRIKLIDVNNNQYSIKNNTPYSELIETNKISIPFTVNTELIKAVSDKLRNKTYYITTTNRYDLNNNLRRGKKFIPVTVKNITYGNYYYPIKLLLVDSYGDEFNEYISVNDNDPMPRKLSSIFSEKNPQLNYPLISNENWNNIINGIVVQGMTKDECRLSLGQPSNIDRQPGYSYMREVWTYEDGRFLIFIDGVLDTFRN